MQERCVSTEGGGTGGNGAAENTTERLRKAIFFFPDLSKIPSWLEGVSRRQQRRPPAGRLGEEGGEGRTKRRDEGRGEGRGDGGSYSE